MSVLIDSLINDLTNNPCYTKINEQWFLAKPYDYVELPWICKVILRIIDAYKVLIGKSYTYHFKEEESK